MWWLRPASATPAGSIAAVVVASTSIFVAWMDDRFGTDCCCWRQQRSLSFSRHAPRVGVPGAQWPPTVVRLSAPHPRHRLLSVEKARTWVGSVEIFAGVLIANDNIAACRVHLIHTPTAAPSSAVREHTTAAQKEGLASALVIRKNGNAWCSSRRGPTDTRHLPGR